MLFQRMWNGMSDSDSGRGRPKRGFSRFLELIGDNLGRFLACNVLCVLSLLPAAGGILWGVSRNNFLAILAAGALGGAIFGPFYGAMVDGMLYAIRDMPGNWWRKYRHALGRDWKDCLLPGAVLGALLALLVTEALIVMLGGSLPGAMYACTAVTLVVLTAVYTYFWPQRVFADLTAIQTLRNSLFMCMAHPTTALKAVLAQGIYWIIMVLLLPHSTLLLPIFGLWMPGLMGLVIVYPQLNEDFRIEERLGITGDDEDDEDGGEEEETE